MRIIDQLKKQHSNDPWFECNHCGVKFKGAHDCDYEKLKQINERYKQALEFYADEKNHTERRGDRVFDDVFYDEGKIARQALKGESS